MKFNLLILLIWLSIVASAQITTVPDLPTASKKVTIVFDSSKSVLGKYTNDLYTHTGVIVEGNTSWKHVIGTWGNNAVQPKLTNKGNGIYELEISPDINSFYSVSPGEKVVKMAFVFRSADASRQTKDLFVDVYQEGLIVSLSTPGNGAIFNKNEDISISATASITANLTLITGGTTIKETTSSTISTTHQFTESGNYWIIAKVNSSGQTVSDSVLIYVKEEVTAAEKPTSYHKGINYPDEQSAGLALWAPEKEFVYVLGDFNDWQVNENYQMKKDGDYFWLTIENLNAGKDYLFQYYIDGEIKIADPYTSQTADPWNDQYIENTTYPNLPTYPTGKTEGIASVLQTGQTPYLWESNNFQAPDKNKLVIYELLIRDFDSKHSYQGVIDHLDYLEDLNINVLELMPVNEFEGNLSWGYNPSFYFAPDKYYGTKNELKKLIDECHKRGIAVVIDLVLNHSYGQSPFVQMYWDKNNNRPAANNPWYNPQSNFQNPNAQWGYDFNHDSQHTRELIDSINSYWMSEYRVDGFRFDFTKGFSNTSYGPSSWGSTYDASRIANLKRMTDEIHKRNPKTFVIFEHLSDNLEEKELADYGIMLWGNMNHNYGEAAMGYVQNTNSDLSWGVYKQRNWNSPQLVSYMESHDDERLTYKLLQWGKSANSYNTKIFSTATDRMELNNVFFIPLPGPKMIWQFGELAYDFSIDYNGRLGEKPIRWDYISNEDRTDLFQVISKLNYLKQTYDEFIDPEISYSLNGATKSYQLKQGENYVVAVGNFDVIEKTTNVSFPKTGTWYDYYNEITMEVTNTEMQITLSPGEYHLYSTRQFEHPHIITENKIFTDTDELKIYPNPATDYLWVESQNELKSIRIFSTDGKQIKQFIPFANKFQITLNELNPGLYFLSATSSSMSKTLKFMVY